MTANLRTFPKDKSEAKFKFLVWFYGILGKVFFTEGILYFSFYHSIKQKILSTVKKTKIQL